MLSFTAQLQNESVIINWSATNENDLNNYVVQKSSNGSSWNDIHTVIPGAAVINNYFITDADKNVSAVYYRLKQLQRTGQPLYSKVLKLGPGNAGAGNITNSTVIKETVALQLTATANYSYLVEIYTVNGSRIKQQQVAVYTGFNAASVDMSAYTGIGLYILTVRNSRGTLLHHSKLIKNQ